MITSRLSNRAAIAAAGIMFFFLPGGAHADDFGKIVHHIETSYHVHRNYRFLMGFAGVVVKCSGPFTGVRDFKMALFENQQLVSSEPDTGLDDVIQSAGEHGWQSIVKSYRRRGHEHTYIYARPEARNLKLLIVSVDRSDSVVIQVKINPDKLAKVIEEHKDYSLRRDVRSGSMAFQ